MRRNHFPQYARMALRAIAAGRVDVPAEALIRHIHFTKPCQDLRCAGIEMPGNELLQAADRLLHLRRGGIQRFQLSQVCELRHQRRSVADGIGLFALLIFLIGGGAAPLFLDLGGELCLFGLIECVKFHRRHSCFQSFTSEGDELRELFLPQFQQSDLVGQRGGMVEIWVI